MIRQTLYDTFNARYLSYHQVADSFVMISHFEKLLRNNHTLLMGPRGCGKTTLLKMLTTPALSRWDSNNSTHLKATVPFHSIYIPTDIQWKRQLEEIEKEFSKDSKFTHLISSATVTINILISLCDTFAFLLSSLSEDSKVSALENEVKLSKQLIESWKIKKDTAPSLSSVSSQLQEMMFNLSAKVNKAILHSKPFDDFDELFFYDFFDLVKIGCTKFEQIIPKASEKRWALCFDELEIAPHWLRFKLLEYLRSSDQKILFKLTTAPIVSLYKEVKENYAINAAEDNDYNVIRIWTSNQKELRGWYEFCNQISKSRIEKMFTNVKSLDDIVGLSKLDLGIIESNSLPKRYVEKDIYGHKTPTWYVFTHLAKIDPSFRKFLEDRDINPKNPVPKDINERNELFRKMRQLAVHRFHFRKENSSKRSRKVVPLYYGLPLLYEICDGNPRFLIGLIDELLASANAGNQQAKPLSINDQSRIITRISERYISVLATYPGSTVTIGNNDKNIKQLLEEIGNYIFNKLVVDDFTMDPSASFRIDQEINSKLVDLLELALYLGAIVYLDGKEAVSEKGILDKKFRLSYILSPYFRLLVREFKDIQLSTILKRTPKDSLQISILDQNED